MNEGGAVVRLSYLAVPGYGGGMNSAKAASRK